MFNKTALKFNDIFEDRLPDSEIEEYLIQLHKKNENVEEIAGALTALIDHISLLPLELEFKNKALDIAKVGEDREVGAIATVGSLILSAACGAYVVRHKNRKILNKQSSPDIIKELGVNLELNISKNAKLFSETGFVYVFANNHYPAMEHITSIRKKISHDTIFNILDPLMNPASAKKHLIGVSSEKYKNILLNVMKKIKSNAMFVSSSDGLNDVSVFGITKIVTLFDDTKREFEINPENYGLKLYEKETIDKKLTLKESAKIVVDVLNGEELGFQRDLILINTAIILMANSVVSNIKDGIDMALGAIESNKAKEKLQQIISISNKI